MRIKSLKIEKLFGCFDYDIDFKDDNITIITGPNGYGKTKCLNIIDAIFNKKFAFFINLDFEKISLALNNEETLHINKGTGKDTNNITISNNKGQPPFTLNKNPYNSTIFNRLERRIPFLEQINDDLIFDRRSGKTLTLDEVYAEYADRIPAVELLMAKNKIPEWLKTFIDFLNVYMVVDQRLISKAPFVEGRYGRPSRNELNHVKTIEKFAKQLSTKFAEIDRNASLKARKLDRSFAVALINNDKDPVTKDTTTIKKELEQITAKRNKLIDFSLEKPTNEKKQITLAPDVEDETIQKNINALELYIEHENKKLASYDKILEKLELFQKIIESKKLTNKKLRFDFKQGFYFESLNSKKKLPLSQLSSGEQHQIVLLYELIFNVKKNTLLLIDEPEISLHVVWQRQVLDDLQAIAKTKKMTVFIATHSPQIVNGKWDLAVNLGDINGAE
jgi:predicted ATP-binding protein involved in virulence